MKVVLMMSLRMSLTVLLFLIFISGVGAQNWGVIYRPNSICAPKGSTVNMSCSYSYPRGHRVQTAFWTKSLPRSSEHPDLLKDPEYRDRVQYLGDKQHDCRFRLSDVRENDQRKYYFRFITDKEGGKFQGKDGVTLSVTDLQVEVPERVMEGDKVTLTCKTTCSLTDRPSFTWYRNGDTLSYRTEQLYLQSVSRKDAGRYSCSVLDQNLRSPEVTLNVRYPPKNISVIIRPSGEIVEGSSVTLTCSSDGNPPVEYTWFKGPSLVVKGQTFTLNNISSVNSEGYKCKSSNEHGYKYSANVTLNVLYPPKSVSVIISPSGEIVEGSSVTLTCSSDGNPPVQNYTWFREGGGSSPVGSGNSYSAVESGSYYCVAQNKHGSQTAAAVTVTVKGHQSSVGYAVLGVCAVCLLVIGAIFFVRRKRRGDSADGADPTQDNVYSTVGEISAVRDSTPGPDPSNQDEVQYATVVPHRLKPSSAVKASSSGTDDEVQYATVQHRREKGVKKPEGGDVQYASVRYSRTGASGRSTAPTMEDLSAIYSNVNYW